MDDDLPDRIRSAECLIKPLILFGIWRDISIGIDHEEIDITLAERVVVLGIWQREVPVVVAGILLMIAEHRLHRDAREQTTHPREELIRPVPLEGSGTGEVAWVNQEARALLPDVIG